MVSFQNLNLKNGCPVYSQLVDYVKVRIHLNEITSGDELPSRRELAGMLGINPNTVQKAYKQLELEGILQTGSNVKSTVTVNEEIKSRVAKELTRGAVSEFVAHAKSIHLTFKDTVDLISKLWD